MASDYFSLVPVLLNFVHVCEMMTKYCNKEIINRGSSYIHDIRAAKLIKE